MKRFAALIVSAALVLSGYSSNVQVFAAADDSETDENIWETVEDAYVYAFPLVLMDATEISATNTEEAVTGKAPVNQFIHSVALANAQFRSVVTPNVDTIYSQVWYNLSEEPMVYELPETDRFCKVQVLDAWTNTAAVLDQAGAYAITLSTWEGELPEGVTRIDVPTSMACGDCGGTTKERYLEILEFTHFVEFFSFNKIGENHKEKILVQRVTVVVALDLGTGNTKNLEYENE